MLFQTSKVTIKNLNHICKLKALKVTTHNNITTVDIKTASAVMTKLAN